MPEVLRESNPPNESEKRSRDLDWSDSDVLWLIARSKFDALAREYHEQHIAEGGQP